MRTLLSMSDASCSRDLPNWVVQPPELVQTCSVLVVNVAHKQPCDVYIGRSTRGRRDLGWGNPAKMAGTSAKARLDAIVSYADHLRGESGLLGRTGELSSRTLGCWCAPKPCHGHILAAVANIAPWERSAVFDWVDELRPASAALPYRLLVTGSRDWQDRKAIAIALNRQHVAWGRPGDAVLVVGDADGADAIAAELWSKVGLPVEVHTADWDKEGKRAGMIRNAEMVASGVDACLAFSRNDSPGTRHCSELAVKSAVPTVVHQSI
jgi:hypothetical protein